MGLRPFGYSQNAACAQDLLQCFHQQADAFIMGLWG